MSSLKEIRQKINHLKRGAEVTFFLAMSTLLLTPGEVDAQDNTTPIILVEELQQEEVEAEKRWDYVGSIGGLVFFGFIILVRQRISPAVTLDKRAKEYRGNQRELKVKIPRFYSKDSRLEYMKINGLSEEQMRKLENR